MVLNAYGRNHFLLRVWRLGGGMTLTHSLIVTVFFYRRRRSYDGTS